MNAGPCSGAASADNLATMKRRDAKATRKVVEKPSNLSYGVLEDKARQRRVVREDEDHVSSYTEKFESDAR